jgi:hypothetical protein
MLKDIKHEQLREVPMLRGDLLGPKEGHHMLKDITQQPQDFILMLKVETKASAPGGGIL